MTARDLDDPYRSNRLRSFSEPLWLPGWSERSVWGYDESTQSYFAQLWRDGVTEAPTAWLTGMDLMERREQVAILVAAVVGISLANVYAAMAR